MHSSTAQPYVQYSKKKKKKKKEEEKKKTKQRYFRRYMTKYTKHIHRENL